jgi:PTS system nitrogen regulatory IIA component
MKAVDFLSRDDVLVDVDVANKVELLRELARHAASAVDLPADQIFSALHKREQLGSTGMGQGIALPHARFAELKHPFGLIARLKRPIMFDAIDEQDVDIVFLLLLPASPQGEQLNALALVARRLRDPQIVSDIRRAAAPANLYHAFAQKT